MNKALILLALLLSACTTTHDINATVEDPITLQPPTVQPMTMRDVQWIVANKEVLSELIDQLGNNDVALFCLDANNYENSALNLQEVLRYVRQQKAVIRYYEERNLSKALKGNTNAQKTNNGMYEQ